jgi:hypothetical protein
MLIDMPRNTQLRALRYRPRLRVVPGYLSSTEEIHQIVDGKSYIIRPVHEFCLEALSEASEWLLVSYPSEEFLL